MTRRRKGRRAVELLTNPLAIATMEWVAVAILGAVSAYLARLGRDFSNTQRATKVLMRSDLISRWKDAREAGWMSDESKRQWSDDHALYLRLVGTNNYLDEVSVWLLDLPSAPADGRDEL